MSGKVIRKGADLERRPAPAWIDGMNLDRFEPVIGENRHEFARFELGPAHPLRHGGDPQSRLDAGDDAFGGSDLHPALNRHRRRGARARKTPAATAGQAWSD